MREKRPLFFVLMSSEKASQIIPDYPKLRISRRKHIIRNEQALGSNPSAGSSFKPLDFNKLGGLLILKALASKDRKTRKNQSCHIELSAFSRQPSSASAACPSISVILSRRRM